MSQLRSRTSTIDIYVKLAQYPILSDKIRARMREEIFRQGYILEEAFEAEVREKAVESQQREGVHNPFQQEPVNLWERRLERIRNFQTDSYFATNFSTPSFEAIIQEILNNQEGTVSNSLKLNFNPEIAPWEMLFSQGEVFEQLPQRQLEKVGHLLEDLKVVLIRRMISDQLPFIGVAKKILSIGDLRYIYQRRIGSGKIGGKAAGMLLAWKILQKQAPDIGADISNQVQIPTSYFIGANVVYEMRELNELTHLVYQKYLSFEEVKADYPKVLQAHLKARLPEKVVDGLRRVLEEVDNKPMIVRSSSLLEDNFGHSFAGKYESHFCPNQGTPEENLVGLIQAILKVYASTFHPDPLLYRLEHGLIDYDERMALLIQVVHGQHYNNFYMPTLAGVGFSQNPFRWNPKIRREEGFLRLVWGMGTRAVDRVGQDYPRMIALSHPQLRPETSAKKIRQYSQKFVDVIDTEKNEFVTLPMRDVLQADYDKMRYLVSVDKGDYLQPMLSALDSTENVVLTFDFLTKDRKFIKLMRTALMRLEQVYGRPVDVEYAVEIVPNYPYPDYKLHILQCRPLSQREENARVEIPADLADENVLFTGHHLVPNGHVEGIRYLVFVDPDVYHSIAKPHVKLEVGRIIGRLNQTLKNDTFILIGPGRWGSSNIELGVSVTYADIYNTKVLIELAAPDGDGPELSYGTHFFQDLVEAKIFALPLDLNNEASKYDWDFFRNSPNMLSKLLPEDEQHEGLLRVIDVGAVSAGKRLTIAMDGEADEAVGYLVAGDWKSGAEQGVVGSF